MQSQNQFQEITPEFFIVPGVNINPGSPELSTIVNLTKNELRDRWNTPAGRTILTRWKTNGFKRDVLDNMVGKFYDHTDLRGIPLINENLAWANLSKIDFYGAILEDSNFKNADFTDSYLSESIIEGACFDYAKMKDVLIDNVRFDYKTTFTGVSLRTIDFNLAAVLQEYAANQQRIESLKSRYPVLAKFLWITCDYGRSFGRFLLWCSAVVVAFGLLYFSLKGLSKPGFWNSIYFSTMVFTSFGSDIQPVTDISRILVAIEVIIGYLMSGLLIGILLKKLINN
jgi:Ion channel/Pentapeptide repeats (8 copies)